MKITVTKFLWIFAIVFAISSCSSDDSTDLPPPTSDNDLAVTTEILNLINNHRQGLNLPNLIINNTAEELALAHVKDMISADEVHSDGYTDRVFKLRGQENALGSVAEFNYKTLTPNELFNRWLSKERNRVVIEGDNTHVGIAAVRDDTGAYYYTTIIYRVRS